MYTKTVIAVLFLTLFVPKSTPITIDCEYKISYGWKVVPDSYGCFVTTLNVNTKTDVTGATGTHLYGNTDAGVKVFNIYGGVCEVIPSGLGSVFPNIEGVAIWNSTLKTVSSTDLQQFSNLRELWLYVNELEYLEGNLFQHNQLVEVIYFNSNKIKYIGGSFFDYLPNLKLAFFWYNECVTGEAVNADRLIAIKDEVRQKCSVLGRKPGGYRTIDWGEFKTVFNKTYASPEEERIRQNIFLQNLLLISSHNILYDQGVEKYSLSANKFTDWTHDEYLKINGVDGSKVSDEDEAVGDGLELETSSICKSSESKDWRKEGAVTPIRDQMKCASCWAFSSVGALEGQFFLKKGVLERLSEQQLVDCSKEHGNNGCNKGFMTKAFKYVQDDGISKGDTYPAYEAKDNQCRITPDSNAKIIEKYNSIPNGSENLLKEVVCDVGPVSVALDATDEKFKFYTEGVYFNKLCKEKVSHAVLVIGYDSDEDTGLDYWIIKNSYGTTWGQQGYGKVARNENNHCGIASIASYPIV